jgi:hypothetical protein
MPARIRFSITVSSEDAGPIEQTILVFLIVIGRVYLKIAFYTRSPRLPEGEKEEELTTE